MRRARLKYGVYEERFRPICRSCKKQWPHCKHSKAPEKVVFVAGPDRIWMQLNGTNYPAVHFRKFNDSSSVEMVMTETQFRSKYVFLGRLTTVITRTDVMQEKAK